MKMRIAYVLLCWICLESLSAQSDIPPVYSNLQPDATGRLTSNLDIGLRRKAARFVLGEVTPGVTGAKDGLRLEFAAKGLRKGKLTYGLIPYGRHSYPTAVLRFEVKIDSAGIVFLNIAVVELFTG